MSPLLLLLLLVLLVLLLSSVSLRFRALAAARHACLKLLKKSLPTALSTRGKACSGTYILAERYSVVAAWLTAPRQNDGAASP